MPGSIWKLIFSTKPKRKTSVRRKPSAPSTPFLPVYTTTPGADEVTLPNTTDPQTYSLTIATLTINDSTTPPPEYEVYDLSPTSIRSSFQL